MSAVLDYKQTLKNHEVVFKNILQDLQCRKPFIVGNIDISQPIEQIFASCSIKKTLTPYIYNFEVYNNIVIITLRSEQLHKICNIYITYKINTDDSVTHVSDKFSCSF